MSSKLPAPPFAPALDGPYTSLEGLIGNREAAERIVLRPSRRATRELAGGHQSRLRGRGMDFEEVRGYQPGDDVRHIDWRVTARTTIPHTKTFSEERERPVLVACDQRAGMFFGSRQRFKSVQAGNIASLLAWSARKRKDRVGGLLIGQDRLQEFRPRPGDRAVLTLLAGLNAFNGALSGARLGEHPGQSLAQALGDLRRLAKTGTSVFVISDFADIDDEGERHLYELSRHNNVWAFVIYDPLERELPPRGVYRVSDGRHEALLDTGSARLRKRHERLVAEHRARLAAALARLGIPRVEVATVDDPLDVLLSVFQRARRGSSHA